MNILLQFKLGICSVFWLGCLRVLLPCTSDFLRRVSTHQHSSCLGCSSGWRQDLSHFLNLQFFSLFWTEVMPLSMQGRLASTPPACLLSTPRNCIYYSLRKFLLEYWFQFDWFCSASCSFPPYTTIFSSPKYFVRTSTDTFKSDGNVQIWTNEQHTKKMA